MAWLTENWFWVVIGVVFVGMHLFGHGGHGRGGGHGGHGGGGGCGGGHGERQPPDKDEQKPRDKPSGHQH